MRNCIFVTNFISLLAYLAGPISVRVMKPVAPRPKPATYPGGGGPKLGFFGTHCSDIYMNIDSYKLSVCKFIQVDEDDSMRNEC